VAIITMTMETTTPIIIRIRLLTRSILTKRRYRVSTATIMAHPTALGGNQRRDV
jgi:hypothetical protein